MDALKEAFVARLAASGHGPPQVDSAREVLVAVGATHAIFCGLRAVLDAGDEVLVAAPYWPLAVGIVRAAGAVPVEVPLTTALYANPSLDAATILEASLTPRTRAVYLITPNNPDGKVLSGIDLASIARFAIAHGLWVIADEVYADYVYDGAARLHRAARRNGGANGVRVLALQEPRARRRPHRVRRCARTRRDGRDARCNHTVFNVPVAAQRVALAALRSPEPWIDAARREYRDARDATLRAFDGSGLRVFSPEAVPTCSSTSRRSSTDGPSRTCSSTPSTGAFCWPPETASGGVRLVGEALLRVGALCARARRRRTTAPGDGSLRGTGARPQVGHEPQVGGSPAVAGSVLASGR